ncbi:MAG: uroporphyrinogen decarboxylase family protein [Planctomycetota bacterium]
MMTSKERMLTALARGVPDRLPITIHQWQDYHLQRYMGGRDQLEAYLAVGLDASVTPGDVQALMPSRDWEHRVEPAGERGEARLTRHRVRTPGGELTWLTSTDAYTTYVIEHALKTYRDAEIFLDYWPETRLDKERLAHWYERTADHGIVRGFIASFVQAGPWQELCELAGTTQAIYWAFDAPAFVHHFLERLTEKKISYVYREMPGARYDLIEQGGGAASSNVISPAMFDEFCVKYDRRINEALREVGFKTVYHTCGAMMALLDHIPANGSDASETLSPPPSGGDIRTVEDRLELKQRLGSKLALIGGIDQVGVLSTGTPAQVEAEVVACFETYGRSGGYIASASDHFFDTPVANLEALARAARRCTY